MGCVRPPREGELGGIPPLSPKRKLRFRRKRKSKKSRKGEVDLDDSEQLRGRDPYERDDEYDDDDDEERSSVVESGDLDFSSQARTLLTVPDAHFARSKTNPYSNTLSSGSGATFKGPLGSRILDMSPKPSPAWRGVFCLPGEEDSVSAIIDVSSIPSQTTMTTPVNSGPALGSSTPGGGRVCRVKEKAQGVIEKPWIFRQNKDQIDRGGVDKEDKGGGREAAGTSEVVRTSSGRERKGVIHIREVDGKLCVVRTVYPSDYGSPVWGGERDSEVEVRQEPPAPSPVAGHVLKVQLSKDRSSAGGSLDQIHLQGTAAARGFSLDTPARAQQRGSLLESGYASDALLTSPETAGTTPSQTDWAGLTSSSSERLDSLVESPLSLQVTVRHLPEVGSPLLPPPLNVRVGVGPPRGPLLPNIICTVTV